MGALIALARGGLMRFGGRSALRRGAVAVGLGGAGSFGASRLFGGDGDGDGDRPRRRRRKRVFTSSDRADISFITATLGSPSGKAVAMIIAARA